MNNHPPNARIAPPVKVPILTYHSIDESDSVISVAPAIFRRQMKFLSEAGYNAVSLGALVKAFAEKKTPPAKTIVLTFDDGFQNFYTKAFPVLEKYNFKATVFLVADHCGKYNDWAGNPPQLPRSSLLSWREIRELSGAGIEFGAHTLSHPDLTRISPVVAEREIAGSKAKIEDAIGIEAATFAYPYGKFNSSVRRLAERNFDAACTTNLGKADAGGDFFSLRRIDSYYLSKPLIFNSLATKTFSQYLRVRQTMRVVKAAFARV